MAVLLRISKQFQGQPGGLLLGGLPVAALRLHSDLSLGALDREGDSERRMVRRTPPFDEPVGGEFPLAGQGQHLQRGFGVDDGERGGIRGAGAVTRTAKAHNGLEPPVLHDGTQDRLQEFGQDALARSVGRETRDRQAQPSGQAGEAGPAATRRTEGE